MRRKKKMKTDGKRTAEEVTVVNNQKEKKRRGEIEQTKTKAVEGRERGRKGKKKKEIATANK
jgi:hypothetical protein